MVGATGLADGKSVFDDSLVFNDAPAFAVGKTARPVPIDARTTCPHDS